MIEYISFGENGHLSVKGGDFEALPLIGRINLDESIDKEIVQDDDIDIKHRLNDENLILETSRSAVCCNI